MAHRLSPFTGLAVLPILALALIFGALSLNSASANQAPTADAPLVSQGFNPQAAPVLTAEAGNGEVTLKWKVASLPSGTSKWQYRVAEAEENYSEDWQNAGSGANVREVTVGSLKNNVGYKFLIRAVDSSTKEIVEIVRSNKIEATPSLPKPTGEMKAPALTVGDGKKEGGKIAVTINWEGDGDEGAAKFQYRIKVAGEEWTDDNDDWKEIDEEPADADAKDDKNFNIADLTVGKKYYVEVKALSSAGGESETKSATSGAVGDERDAVKAPTLKPGSSTPGAATDYFLTFTYRGDRIEITSSIIKIDMEDYGVPRAINRSDVRVRFKGKALEKVRSPRKVTTDGEDVTIHLHEDLNGYSTGGAKEDAKFEITFHEGAGIKNPTEAKGATGYEWVVEYAGTEYKPNPNPHPIRKVSLGEEDGGRGDVVTATGKGFKNGTQITFFLDKGKDGGVYDSAKDVILCSSLIGSDDVGRCDITISNPPFVAGDNFVNAYHGADNRETSQLPYNHEDQKFELKPSVSVTPDTASPGETVTVQLSDFPNGSVTEVTLSGLDVNHDPIKNEKVNNYASVGITNGEADFALTIPNNASSGKQTLVVKGGDGDADVNITIGAPKITATPTRVVANQKVSLVGSGFNAGSEITEITIGGDEVKPNRINGGNDVNVDNGGNWSTAVDLPLTTSTTTVGSHVVKVTDSDGRTGRFSIEVPAREVTITPDTSRVGTTVVVRGKNFPSKNDDGSPVNVSIVYTSGNREASYSANPDASGSFEQEIRVPTNANIPSENTVKVQFENDSGVMVVTTVIHHVPEGEIKLSENSGPRGTRVTIMGNGFKSYVPVQSVKVGSIEVTPAPAPATDDQGELNFDIMIPGLDNGLQTVEVQVSGTTASVPFTVKPSGVASGKPTPVAEAVEALGGNFVRSFHFNNDTKAWTFYDMENADISDQTHFVAGETYQVFVKQTQEVILNGKTRNLTCVGGNCQNLIVW